MARVYISIGSNIEPALNIRSAVSTLHHCYGELILSRVYESEAVGFEGDNFYNLVAGFETADGIQQVATQLRQIEDDHARNRRGPRFSSRTIDLDLLLYDDFICNENGLNVPRDEITENAFVLQPLAEVAGDAVHPLLQQTIAALWKAFDKNCQQLWPIDFEWDSPVIPLRNSTLNSPT